MVVLVAASPAALADTRFEIGAGISAEHLSGGTCSDSGAVGDCPGVWGGSMSLEVAEVFGISKRTFVVGREAAGLGVSTRGTMARGYLGLGPRVAWSRWYIEVTAGGETMFGDTGTGESGIASDTVFAVSPRIGVHTGAWELELATVILSTVSRAGLPDFDAGIVVSRSLQID